MLRPSSQEDGPIDAPKTVADVRQEPYALPDRCARALGGRVALPVSDCGAGLHCAARGSGAWREAAGLARALIPSPSLSNTRSFEWADCNVGDAGEAREVYELLSLNYVEDDDAMFRCGGGGVKQRCRAAAACGGAQQWSSGCTRRPPLPGA